MYMYVCLCGANGDARCSFANRVGAICIVQPFPCFDVSCDSCAVSIGIGKSTQQTNVNIGLVLVLVLMNLESRWLTMTPCSLCAQDSFVQAMFLLSVNEREEALEVFSPW